MPLLFQLGRQTSLARLATLSDVLPVAPEAPRAGFSDVQLAPPSTDHPVLSDLGIPAARLGALPPLAASPTRWALQPGSQTLLRAEGSGAPILAVRQTSTVRTAALLGTGTWRWRMLPDDLSDLAPLYPALTNRLVRWTTAARDRRPVRVRTNRARCSASASW